MANADCILIEGSNMAEAHPVGFQWVMEAKKRGAKVIHVDPRFTRTSANADRHIPIRSGSDIALLGGVIRYVLMNAFVVIRLTDSVPLPLPITDEHTARSVFEWLCWVVPLLATEAWLSWRPLLRAVATRSVATGSATTPTRTR